MSIEMQISDMSLEKQNALRLSHNYLMPHRVETWLSMGLPFVMDNREGYRIWDMDGHELQDFHLNGGVFNLGHRNPVLVGQLHEGLERLDVGNHHFPSLTRGLLAEQLALNTPDPLHYSVFTPSANEIRIFNDVSEFFCRAKVAPNIRPGQIVSYNGWEPLQYKNWNGSNEIEPGMVKWSGFSGGYGHLNFTFLGWQPVPIDRWSGV